MLIAILAHVMLLAAQPVAAPASPPVVAQAGPPPAPAFEVEPFRFLLGRWRGEGTFFNGKPVSSQMTFTLANRTTLQVEGVEDAPNTYRYVALWSREKGSKELLMLLSSSLDGPALYRSAGWVGDRLVFEPKAGVETGPSRVRFTYVRKGADAYDLTYEFSIGEKWIVGDRQSFTRLK